MAHSILLESRSFRPFKSSEEYLYAMKEDLAEWLNTLYPHLSVNVDNFMETLETGVVLCEHANNVRRQATEYLTRKQLKKSMSCSALTVSILSRTAVPIVEMGDITFRSGAKPETFFARDNVSNFIDFARKGLEILECLLFETEDLIGRKNEKNVILCLLEVARKGAKYGMLAPILIQMEKEIDREIAADRGETAEESSDDDDDELSNMRRGPIPQIVTNDLKSLDEMVRDLLEQCHCPTQFPMIRVSEGKYRIGDTKMLIFVRILRNHVMVRVGGGWDTLSHYLDKHDPCRCKTVHRAAVGSKIVQKSHQPYEAMDDAFVHYDRTRRSSASSSSSGQGGREATDIGPRGRSRSPTPNKSNLHTPKYSYVSTYNFPGRQRSASPNPQFLTSHPSRSPAPSRRRSHDMSSTSSRRTPSPRRSRGNENLVSPSPQRRQLNISNPRRSPSASRRSSDEPISSPGPRRKLTPRDPRQGRSRSPGKHLTVTSYDQPTASSRNRSRSPSVQPLKESSNYRSPDDVSDDGYLSVGYEEKRRRESQTTDCSEREGDIEKPLLKNGSINGSRTEMNDSRETSREPSVSSRCSPERSRQFSTDSPYRRGSMTRSRSASSDSSVFDGPRRLSGDKCGTWNGKLKGKRTMVSCENFQRGGLGRSSLGAKTEYDPKTGRRLTPVSPLVSDLLQVKNLDDDKVILQKMKELISQYSDLLEKNEEPGEKGICRRKDSKHKSGITKIPAPVFYKQPSTEKEF